MYLLTKFDPDLIPDTYYYVILSDNSYVYEDKVAGLQCTWLRLKEHVEKTGLKICRLFLAHKNRGDCAATLDNARGYWQSKSCGRILDGDFGEKIRHGIGHIDDSEISRGENLSIYWIDEATGELEVETRPVQANSPALILN